jgi:hypothetical protein
LKNSFFNSQQQRPDFATGVIPYPVRRAKSGKSGRQRFGNAKIAKALGRQPIWKMGERRHFFNILLGDIPLSTRAPCKSPPDGDPLCRHSEQIQAVSAGCAPPMQCGNCARYFHYCLELAHR